MPTGKTAQPLSRPATLLLACVAGCVDAIGYATLFGLYTAHMTGNSVGSASKLVDHHFVKAAWHAAPIPVFVVGAFVGAVVARTLHSRTVTLACEGTALLAFMLLAHDAHGPRLWLAATMPAFAMGLQAVTFRRCGDTTVQTTYITGMLAAFADAVVAWLFSRRGAARAQIAFGIWCGYVVGALTGTVTVAIAHAWATALPVLGLAVVAVLTARTARASPAHREWPMRA
jgi:uncharacterized membrane protein YoaK (UPF0700 family)